MVETLAVTPSYKSTVEPRVRTLSTDFPAGERPVEATELDGDSGAAAVGGLLGEIDDESAGSFRLPLSPGSRVGTNISTR
jgi:hypothetical protein